MAMTDRKLLDLFDLYCDADTWRERAPAHEALFEHVAGMREAASVLVRRGRREKAMRWLGFMQGVMVATGVLTVEQVKRHSMPDGAEYREVAR